MRVEHRRRIAHHCDGFSSIVLLVVIAIIAVLIAPLQHAAQAACEVPR